MTNNTKSQLEMDEELLKETQRIIRDDRGSKRDSIRSRFKYQLQYGSKPSSVTIRSSIHYSDLEGLLAAQARVSEAKARREGAEIIIERVRDILKESKSPDSSYIDKDTLIAGIQFLLLESEDLDSILDTNETE